MKFDPNAMSGGSPAAKLFGKDLKIFLGDVELTGFIDGAELEQTPMSVGLALVLQIPYEVAYQSKPKPYGYNKLKGAQAPYIIQDEVVITEDFLANAASKQLKPYVTKYPPPPTESDVLVLEKIAQEMVDKKKGIPHE